jgi:hypothetical protein
MNSKSRHRGESTGLVRKKRARTALSFVCGQRVLCAGESCQFAILQFDLDAEEGRALLQHEDGHVHGWEPIRKLRAVPSRGPTAADVTAVLENTTRMLEAGTQMMLALDRSVTSARKCITPEADLQAEVELLRALLAAAVPVGVTVCVDGAASLGVPPSFAIDYDSDGRAHYRRIR